MGDAAFPSSPCGRARISDVAVYQCPQEYLDIHGEPARLTFQSGSSQVQNDPISGLVQQYFWHIKMDRWSGVTLLILCHAEIRDHTSGTYEMESRW